MKKTLLSLAALVLLFTGCEETQVLQIKKSVQSQQSHYAETQPIHTYDWSLEREMVIKIYDLRNEKVLTHSVWRSGTGMIEGDCSSMGYGLPYDTSLTNPLQAVGTTTSKTSIGQAEPNGIFASTNTSATWIMCINETGGFDPVYVESYVTVYPYNVNVDYKTNRVTKAGKSNIKFEIGK